jgi:radical SAM protein with 4Fe4S-binding SPASM domain
MIFGRKRVLSLPRYVQVEPTNLCNQKCEFCPRNTHMDAPLGAMSFENFKKIYEQIPTIKDLQLNGLGEPLLNEDIFKMIKYAKEKGSTVVMTSNCELMTKEKAKELVKSGLDILKISMDTNDPVLYAKVRHGDLEKALDGIKNIVEARREAGGKTPKLWFNSIIMKSNYDKMLNIVKLGADLGVDLARFKPIDTFDVYKDKNLKVVDGELFSKIKLAIEEAKKYTIRHNLESLLDKKEIYYRPKDADCPCYSPWLEVYIQWYGGVRLCCEFYSKKFDVGNMFEKSFKEIWNGRAMRNIRREFAKGKMNFPVCDTCNRFQRNITINNKIEKIWKKKK